MRVHLVVLERKRQERVRLFAEWHVADSVMWDIQQLLDSEESRMDARLPTRRNGY